MDEIELEKETYEKVVSLIQSGKSARAIKAILPEADDDPALAQTVLTAIEKTLARKSRSSSKKKKEADKEGEQEIADSSDSKSSPSNSILLPSEEASDRKRKSTLRGDHKGIHEIELEKEAFDEVVDLIKAGNTEESLDLILEEVNQDETLAKKVLAGIERTLADKKPAEKVTEKPAAKASSPSSAAPASPETKPEKTKEEKSLVKVAESASELAVESKEKLDPVEQAKKEIRRTSLIVLFLGGILGYWFFRSGMRPRKAILTNFVICLFAALAIGYFVFAGQGRGQRPGSDPTDQEVLNFVAVALCPLLADNLDLHAGQRIFCSQKRNRFAYYLYEESRKIDGSETIRGPFSQETLRAGLHNLGKQIRDKLNRRQRKQFLELYESGQWRQVDIVDENGRFRLEYPTYGNAPGVLPLSVDRKE